LAASLDLLLTAAGPREAPIPLIETTLMRYRQ
jgi:hypothetical protein